MTHKTYPTECLYCNRIGCKCDGCLFELSNQIGHYNDSQDSECDGCLNYNNNNKIFRICRFFDCDNIISFLIARNMNIPLKKFKKKIRK